MNMEADVLNYTENCGHKRLKVGNTNVEEKKTDAYFRSYADIGIHAEMLKDIVRTRTYKHAILRNYKSLYNKVVLDVGCGTGVLSMFCVLAGAKKVYGVEASSMAEQARKLIKSNQMQDKIEILHSKVEDVDLPEQVDVIVSEWMGYFLLYESMLPSVLAARDKWLKKGGLMLPSRAHIFLTPATADAEYEENIDLWSHIGEPYKVDFSVLKQYAEDCKAHNAHIKCIPPEHIMAHAVKLCTLDLNEVTVKDATEIVADFKWNCFGKGLIRSLVGWFTVDFPEDISLSTSPYSEPTHWQQTVFYLNQPVDVEQDTEISGQVSIKPGSRNHRFLDIALTYRKDNGQEHGQNLTMDDFVT